MPKAPFNVQRPGKNALKGGVNVRIALYMRVSTDEQSVDMQKEQLLQWADKHGHTIFTEFVDDAQSGKTLDRPGFQSLLRSAAYKGFEGVAVYRVDRLGRKVEDLIGVIKKFNEMGIKLFSATDQHVIDRISPAGKLQSTVMLAVAEYERDIAIERTRHGVETALAKGHHVIKPPFGFAMKDHRFVPDRNKAAIVKEIYSDRAGGMSWNKLSTKYNLPRTKVRRILSNPIYRTGEIRLKGKVVGHVDKIIQ